MASRLELHNELIDILGTSGEQYSRVYFQPPGSPTPSMEYPCIRYKRSGIDVKRADDKFYTGTNRYEVIVIDYAVDSEIPDAILKRFKMCSFDRSYTADNLSHTVLTLYY